MQALPQQSKRTDTRILLAFCLSVLYVFVFLLAFLLTADLVASSVPQATGSLVQVWLPPILIGAGASVLCSLPLLFLKEKVLVPLAFGFVALYAVLMFFYALRQPAGAGAVLRQLVAIYLVVPALCGNLIGWGGYHLVKKRSIHYKR